MGGSLSFPKENLKDKVVVVTGGNTGIGYETAKWIAMLGARVIIACRSEERAEKAIENMQAEFQILKDNNTPDIISEDKVDVKFMKLDCASLKSTVDFITAFLGKEDRLHILVCNAGVAMHPQAYTEDGFEIMFQVNYLSQFLIALKFLPVMKKSGEDCRMILVSSNAHYYSKFEMDKIQGKQLNERNFDRFGYYAKSKVYQVMQMYSMNQRLRSTGVTVNSVHPGMVATEISRNFGGMTAVKAIFFLGSLVGKLKSPYEGAKTVIKAAISPEYKGSRDNYYEDCQAKTANDTARNKRYQEQLWNYTLECLKEYITEDDLNEFEFVNMPLEN